MSDKITVAATDYEGFQLRGYVDPQEAIEALRAHCLDQIEDASKAIEEIDAGNVRVYHQLGRYAARKQRQVWPEEGDE